MPKAALFGWVFAVGGAAADESSVLLVDEEGSLKVVYPYGIPAQGIADDVRYILRH